MKKPRTVQFVAAGACIALMLAVAGHRLDSAVPAMNLERQVLYNWLALIFSPASFLLRLNDPDGPIVPSVSFAAVAMALNAVWYAAARRVYLVVAQPTAARASAILPALAAAAGSSSSLASHRGSPSERLADRYEHRLSAEQAATTPTADTELAVLSESSSR